MTSFVTIVTTCDERPFLVKVLGDAVEPGQVDDSQTKTFFGCYQMEMHVFLCLFPRFGIETSRRRILGFRIDL